MKLCYKNKCRKLWNVIYNACSMLPFVVNILYDHVEYINVEINLIFF